MILRFLGTGTSIGVPVMRCRCDVCTSTDPRDNRLRASVLLQTEPGAPCILIDCGPDFRQQILRLGSPDLACALLTHTHYDHVGGIDDLRPYTYGAPGQHFPLYCPEDVARDLRSRVPYCFTENPYPGVPQFTLHCPKPFEPFVVDLGKGFKPVEVEPLAVRHGILDIYGYRIGNLAYITDASELCPRTIDRIRGIDTLVLNALRPQKHPSHLNFEQAIGVIKETRPRQAFFTHFSHDAGLQAITEASLPAPVKMAYDGLKVAISDRQL